MGLFTWTRPVLLASMFCRRQFGRSVSEAPLDNRGKQLQSQTDLACCGATK